ncbi:MAG: hypothetical protein V1826_01120 [bacterium]
MLNPESNFESDNPASFSEQLARACHEIFSVSVEDCGEIATLPGDEALGYVYTLALEHGVGVERLEELLRAQGFLE